MNCLRFRSFLAIAAIVLTLFPCLARAEYFGMYEYSVHNGSVTITGYQGGLVGGEIPSVIDGMPVTEIGESAFLYKFFARNTIPATVTKIGANAFYGSRNHESLVIPSSVITIGDRAFAGSKRMRELKLPASLKEIGVDVFADCYNLSSVTLEKGLGEIGPGMFRNCLSNLTHIVIPSSVVRIGDEAFSNCVKLTGVQLSSGLSEIGARAFSDCGMIEEVVIPSSVTRLGDQVFWNCVGLESISIPDSVESIGDEAFALCHGLTSIAFSEGLKKIGAKALFKTSVIRIDLPNSVNELGAGVFEECRKLKKASLSKNLVEIPDFSFFGCKSLKKVKIPSAVKRIGESAFEGTGLKSVKLGKSLRDIGTRAFANCNGLSRVTFPPKVRSIGKFAIGSVNLKSLIFTGKAPREMPKASSFDRRFNPELAIYLEKGATGFTVPRWHGYVTRRASPEINVSMKGKRDFVDGDARVRFPEVIAGSGSSVKRITLENLGNRKLKNLSVKITGANPWDYSLKSLTKDSLAPGESAFLVIEFVPRRKGKSHATLEILSNDRNEGILVVDLIGLGVELVR